MAFIIKFSIILITMQAFNLQIMHSVYYVNYFY